MGLWWLVIHNLLKFNSRGQFFSPDLIIAIGVFLIGLAFFFNASNNIFAQADLINERKNVDEVAHMVLSGLVLSPGVPSNWENGSLSDVNSFGLALSANVIDSDKAVKLVNYLNNSSNYIIAKNALGAGRYDFYLRIFDANGTIYSDGVSLAGGDYSSSLKSKYYYQRIVFVEGKQAVLEGVVSVSE